MDTLRQEGLKMGKYKDLTGMKFNRLTAIEPAGKDKYGKYLWRCKCDCGNEVITLGRGLINGHCKSCGCMKSICKKEIGTARGLSHTRIYGIWVGMIRRCSNPNYISYKYYGGKGISVCPDWQGEQGFFNFLGWAIENGYREYLTIDRIDGEKDYCPNNCRWADYSTQRRNQHRTMIGNQYGHWAIKKQEEQENEQCMDSV